ncbi:MAG: hypothetical protein RLZZ58_1471 [Pseudomonadota bacterium]
MDMAGYFRCGLTVLTGSLALLAAPLQAKAPLDCPMRDAPFSVDGPFIDMMLSDKAKAAFEAHMPGALAKLPPIMAGTTAPSFGSIMTPRKLMGLAGGGAAMDAGQLDAALRAIAVTDADRALRCARYDDDRPAFPRSKGKLRVLLFEKMTGFRDTPSVEAANAAFRGLADRNGWALSVTDKGGAMHRSVLEHFDVVIWNNVSGDVLTLTQRAAFRKWVEGGGGFVGVHGTGGDPVYFWDWYPDTLIGARFIGHPSDPQFQDARIQVEARPDGLAADLLPGWTMKDEWYSFEKSARLSGGHVIATLDEASYVPGTNRFGGPSLSMGADHPIAWTRCLGKGRSVYSAIGHRPETYADANHLKLLQQAIIWAGKGKKVKCI